MINVVKGQTLPGDDEPLPTLKVLALHGDIMRKSIGKAGFSGRWGWGWGWGEAGGRRLHESPPETGWYFQVR